MIKGIQYVFGTARRKTECNTFQREFFFVIVTKDSEEMRSQALVRRHLYNTASATVSYMISYFFFIHSTKVRRLATIHRPTIKIAWGGWYVIGVYWSIDLINAVVLWRSYLVFACLTHTYILIFGAGCFYFIKSCWTNLIQYAHYIITLQYI